MPMAFSRSISSRSVIRLPSGLKYCQKRPRRLRVIPGTWSST